MALDGSSTSLTTIALVIDNDASSRRGRMRTLTRTGLAPLGFETAETAIAWMQENGAPALVLVDVTLPRMSGFALCSWVREHLRAVPVIAAKAHGLELEDHARALELDVELLDQPRELGAIAAKLTGTKPQAALASALWTKLVAAASEALDMGPALFDAKRK